MYKTILKIFSLNNNLKKNYYLKIQKNIYKII